MKPLYIRKIINAWQRFLEKVITAYFIILRRIIPCKIVSVDVCCPLDKKQVIRTGILTTNAQFELSEILDVVCKSVERHFKAEHNIKEFAGLEFMTKDAKYTIWKGYMPKEEKGADNVQR